MVAIIFSPTVLTRRDGESGESEGWGLDKVHGTWLNKVLETEREVKSFCQQRRVEP